MPLRALSQKASYWVHSVLGNWADRFYVHSIGDIKEVQTRLESAQFEAQDALIETVNKLKESNHESDSHDMANYDVVCDFLTETSQSASEMELVTFTDLLFKLFAKFKDGQRVDDFHASVFAPTKLFYPRWWLDAVGFFEPFATSNDDDDEDVAVESSVSPSIMNSSIHASFISHALVALLSVFATVSFMKHFSSYDTFSKQHYPIVTKKEQEDSTSLFGPKSSMKKVELTPLVGKISTTHSYQQVI